MSKLQTLQKEIIGKSKAQTWDKAKEEWFIYDIAFEQDGVCLCGKRPITERIKIKNSKTLKTAVIGNVCACKFSCDHLKITNRATASLKKLLILGSHVQDIDSYKKGIDDTFVVNNDLLEFFSTNSLLDEKDIVKYNVVSSGYGSRKKTHWKSKERMKLNRCMAFALKNISQHPYCKKYRIPKNAKMNKKTWQCFWGCPKYMEYHQCPNVVDESIITEFKIVKSKNENSLNKRKRIQDSNTKQKMPSKKMC